MATVESSQPDLETGRDVVRAPAAQESAPDEPIHRDSDGTLGIITAFILAIPCRFALDLTHIIWLAIILQRYAHKWPDSISQGGARVTGSCFKLYEYERKMLLAEIVLFSIDIPTVCLACYIAKRRGGSFDTGTLYSVLSLTPSYLARLGMSVGGMYWIREAWEETDRNQCNDLWYGGAGLFVIAGGFVIWAWVCIVIYDFWKKSVTKGDLERAPMPPFLGGCLKSLEWHQFAVWVAYQWHVVQLLSYVVNFAQAIQLIQKYRAGEKNPIFGKAALLLSVVNLVLFILTTLLSWFGARFSHSLMLANTNTKSFEFLTYFVPQKKEVIDYRQQQRTDPLRNSDKCHLFFTVFLGVSWFVLNFLLTAADMTDGFKNVGQSPHGQLYAVLLLVQQVQQIFNNFLQAIGSIVLPVIVVLDAFRHHEHERWRKWAEFAMSKMDVLDEEARPPQSCGPEATSVSRPPGFESPQPSVAVQQDATVASDGGEAAEPPSLPSPAPESPQPGVELASDGGEAPESPSLPSPAPESPQPGAELASDGGEAHESPSLPAPAPQSPEMVSDGGEAAEPPSPPAPTAQSLAGEAPSPAQPEVDVGQVAEPVPPLGEGVEEPDDEGLEL